MLQTFRDRLTGPVIWVVILLITVPFAFWGIQSFRGGGSDPTVAKVAGVKITQSQYRRQYEREYGQFARMMGENFRPGMVDTPRFRKGVLDSMIEDTALRQFAHKAGYRTSDAQLLEEIRQLPQFQKDGKFSDSAYHQALSTMGDSPDAFEGRLRTALTTEQIRQAILGSAFVAPAGVARVRALDEEQRSFNYARIDPAQYASKVEVTDAQLHAQYDAHKSDYMSPERVKLAYVELALDKMGKQAKPSADVLKAIYDAQKASRFSVPEERHAEHILIKFGGDKEAARKKAEALVTKLRNGADFSDVAKAESQDIGSKAKGGDLGWVRRGQMVPAFENALFGMQAGQISDPVESPFGWHIIKLEAIRPATVKPFDDPQVQAELLDEFEKRDAAQRFQDAADKLEQIAFENPSSLDPVAKALGLTVQSTEWLTRDDTSGIFKTPAVRQAAFSSDVLDDGENSKPIQTGPNSEIVLRKVDHEAPRQLSFDEVSAKIREQLVAKAEKDKAAAVADAVLAAIAKGQPFTDAAKAQSLTVTAVDDAGRSQKDVPPALLDEAFKLPRPAANAVTTGRTTLPQDVVAVIALRAVKTPDLSADTDSPEAKRLAASLRESEAGAEFDAYQTALRARLGVEIVNDPTQSQSNPLEQ
jgi:peptidyl-prolyl cis-trans isomerase D